MLCGGSYVVYGVFLFFLVFSDAGNFVVCPAREDNSANFELRNLLQEIAGQARNDPPLKSGGRHQ